MISNSLQVSFALGEGQQTREEAHAARTEAGTHPAQITDFNLETHAGKKFTADDLKGTFSIIMFGDSVTDHALQGLHKMQEIVTEQGECFAGTCVHMLIKCNSKRFSQPVQSDKTTHSHLLTVPLLCR